MQPIAFETLADWARRPDAAWSIGSFGAIGEFVRDPDEPADLREDDAGLTVATPRGALRLLRGEPRPAVAWDSLSSDGETWGHALAVLTPQPEAPDVVRELGPDAEAVREEDRDARLFDMGVGLGAVRMMARTRDAALIAALRAAEGARLLERPELGGEVLRAQPHRVLTSPAGRIEVFQPIPPPDGRSPAGPHTHLLPALIAKRRAHSANTPVPQGWQSALNLHPASPWRTPLGERRPFDAEADAAFAPLLERHAPEEDALAVRRLVAALDHGEAPEAAAWPDTRRGRTKARVQLRRLAAAGDPRVDAWRTRFDRLDPQEDEALDREAA